MNTPKEVNKKFYQNSKFSYWSAIIIRKNIRGGVFNNIITYILKKSMKKTTCTSIVFF